MHEKDLIASLQRMRSESKSRRFVQSVEFIVNFRGLDFKKAQNQVDVKVSLPHATGRAGGKTLVFARDKNFASALEGKVDRIIMEPQIEKLSKKDVAEIAQAFDVLLAEGPVMLTVGKFLGQELAPKGKMPKPAQPDADAVVESLKTMSNVVRVTNKKGKFMPIVQTVIGSEKNEDKQLAENALAIYDTVLNALPRKKENIKSCYVKLTMGPPIKVGEKPQQEPKQAAESKQAHALKGEKQ